MRLYCNTCPHHVIIEGRPTVFGHENWLDEKTDTADIAPQPHRHLMLAVAVGRHDNSHVDITVRIGIALAIGAVHHNARFDIETGADDFLISTDEGEGLDVVIGNEVEKVVLVVIHLLVESTAFGQTCMADLRAGCHTSRLLTSFL